MVKYIVIASMLLLSVSSMSYGQDADNPVNKSLSFYVCGASGNINPETGKILGSYGEAGIDFSQNFANTPWLSISATLAICTGMNGLKKVGDEWVGASSGGIANDGDQLGSVNGSSGGILTGGYANVKLNFDRYFTFGFHTQGRFDFDLKYGIVLPANQRLTVRAYYEIYMLGKAFYRTAEDLVNDSPTGSVLSHMDYRLTYHVQFHPEWAYELDTRFRFNGGADDSLTAVRDSFSIRLNNTLYYSNPNGFGGWMQFRYQPEKILLGSKNVVHNISLHAGISYSYDLSAL